MVDVSWRGYGEGKGYGIRDVEGKGRETVELLGCSKVEDVHVGDELRRGREEAVERLEERLRRSRKAL